MKWKVIKGKKWNRQCSAVQCSAVQCSTWHFPSWHLHILISSPSIFPICTPSTTPPHSMLYHTSHTYSHTYFQTLVKHFRVCSLLAVWSLPLWTITATSRTETANSPDCCKKVWEERWVAEAFHGRLAQYLIFSLSSISFHSSYSNASHRMVISLISHLAFISSAFHLTFTAFIHCIQAKTVIIATLSSSVNNIEETISTLDYAYRAKSIKNQPTGNYYTCHHFDLCIVESTTRQQFVDNFCPQKWPLRTTILTLILSNVRQVNPEMLGFF